MTSPRVGAFIQQSFPGFLAVEMARLIKFITEVNDKEGKKAVNLLLGSISVDKRLIINRNQFFYLWPSSEQSPSVACHSDSATPA